jgi:spoIIIJ-associated protein
MKQKKTIEVEGTTVEEAIKKALEELKMARDKVKIEILYEGVKGLFGMPGAKPAKIRAAVIKDKEKA